jgi:hypothetical protein
MDAGRRADTKPLRRIGAAFGERMGRYPAWVGRNFRPIVLLSLALAMIGGFLASRLPLRTEFSWLLPDRQPSVVALRQLTARKPSSAVIEIGVASTSPEATRRFAADLAKALREKLPKDLLSEVDEDDLEIRKFVWDHRHLYAPLPDLQTALDGVQEMVAKRGPFNLDLDDAPDPKTSTVALDELRAKLDKARRAFEREPGYVGEEGKLRMLVLRCRFADSDPESGLRTLQALDSIVAELGPSRRDPPVEVGSAGDPVSAAREHDIVLHDVVLSTVLCLLLVTGVLLAYFRALRAVLALCVTLAVACCVTFGFTRLWIGHLNTSTAFLGSVVAGNGINFGVILLARYFEERRRQGASHEVAIAAALSSTAIPTLVACAAAGSAYLSLTITSFRGFSEFGIIAGSGMIFCWIAFYLVLPALLTWLECRGPLVRAAASPSPKSDRGWLDRRGRLLGGAAVAFVLISGGVSMFGAYQLWGDPFEDDVTTMRSRSYPTSPTGRWSRRLDAAFNRDQSGGFYIGVERAEDVATIARAVHKIEQDVPAPKRLLGKVDALSEVLPGDLAEQREKIRVLTELSRLSDRLASRLAPGSDDAKLLAELRPPPVDALRPVTFADLPERARRTFTENDGRVGLLMAVHPGDAFDGKSFRTMARAVGLLRSLDLPPEVRAKAQISGSDAIFADIMDAVEHEGPRASFLSLGFVLLLLFLTFGPRRDMALTTVALFIGVFGMFGLMTLFGVRLNFLNYIAIPITIGIGVDYPFNVVARIRQEREHGHGRWSGVFRTAAAVALCSSTTIIGYAVLLISDTGAIRSFGTAAVLGEITAIASALLLVPALVLLGELRARRLAAQQAPVPEARG